MKYARIVDGFVWEVFKPWFPGVDDINEYFHPDIVKQFTECPEEVGQSWLYDSNTGTFSHPYVEPLEQPDGEEKSGDQGSGD